MVTSQRDLKIRETMDTDEFGAWLADLVQHHPSSAHAGEPVEPHHLVLTDEIGDWIGGISYTLRGGVANLVLIGVAPHERGQGHSLRLLEAFEAAAIDRGAHLLEFSTDELRGEAFLAALGWRRVLARRNFVGHRTWYILEKPLPGA